MTLKNDREAFSSEILKEMSPQDFLIYGMEDIAYIRSIDLDGEKAYAIHAANGQTLSVLDTESDAIIAIEQNGLDTTRLH